MLPALYKRESGIELINIKLGDVLTLTLKVFQGKASLSVMWY